MINLTGKWNIVESIQFNDEKGCMEWAKAEDILAKEDVDREIAMLIKSIVLFEEDGNLVFLTPLPEGVSQAEVDAAVAAGKIKLRDGMMLTQQNHWKVENGKNMADTGAEGEVLGEKVGPWEEIKEVDENTIELMFYRLRKA
jgi:hypothetical protein